MLSCPPLRQASEAGSFSRVPEQRTKTCPVKAQSTAIARAMARICNAERVRFGVRSGHGRKTLSLSDAAGQFSHRAPGSVDGSIQIGPACTVGTGHGNVAHGPG